MSARDRTNYPLTVSVDDTGTGFGLTVDAVAPADPRQVCALLCTAWTTWSPRWSTPRPPRCGEVQVLDEAERAQLVAGWNDTAVPVPGGDGAGAVVARAAGAPDAVAVACGEVRV